jgi:PPOX class probable F420-dependent enzyme
LIDAVYYIEEHMSMMLAVSPMESLRLSRTALLTTFRHNGQGIATQVEIHVVNSNAYFYTWSTTGKVKRMSSNPHVTLAPCTLQGRVTGQAIEGVARLLESSEAARVQPMIGGRFQRWLWKLYNRHPHHAEQLLYEVSLTNVFPRRGAK